eukprot:TRINITY_DN43349_c0_g1_i1.p1 TRINITY_DN43349_c0_g1~~TRINITY_DN43349_c0_g1_i1.p1  ORF type:complete len:154 (-),score=3.21 TRINITY_DN43349_c0_g1_i1:187-588(-)
MERGAGRSLPAFTWEALIGSNVKEDNEPQGWLFTNRGGEDPNSFAVECRWILFPGETFQVERPARIVVLPSVKALSDGSWYLLNLDGLDIFVGRYDQASATFFDVSGHGDAPVRVGERQFTTLGLIDSLQIDV